MINRATQFVKLNESVIYGSLLARDSGAEIVHAYQHVVRIALQTEARMKSLSNMTGGMRWPLRLVGARTERMPSCPGFDERMKFLQ